jgi:hypothetical protein
VEGVFDVKAVRAALEARLRSVEAEKQQVSRQTGAVGLTQRPRAFASSCFGVAQVIAV